MQQPHDPPPPPMQMTQMLLARWCSQAIGAAARFGYADHLAAGPRSAEELAGLTGTHGPSVHRLLRALASFGIFAETEAGRFTNTPLSETLRTDVPGSVRGMALFVNHEVHLQAWTGLPHAIQTGASAFEHIHKEPVWQLATRRKDVADVFNDAMTSLSAQIGGAVAQTYDFSGLGTLADVGGGHGMLLSAILAANSSLKGIVFDLPHVVEGAGALLAKQGVAARCQVVGGNFFEKVPAADGYILKHILHDWSDEDSARILRSIHQASKPGARLLIADSVIAPGNAPDLGKLVDLEMLVITSGGRERTAEEFGRLFEQTGFQLNRILPTPSPVCIVEGTRV